MPRLEQFDSLNEGLEERKTGTFGFSGANLDTLGAAQYTLVSIVIDVSGSTGGFRVPMTESLKQTVRACRDSPRADNLLLQVIVFGTEVFEIHGFKKLADCNPDDYDNVLYETRGATALCDAAITGIDALREFGVELQEEDIDVNGVIFTITDGEENKSTKVGPTDDKAKFVRESMEQVTRVESLETLTSCLISLDHDDNVEYVIVPSKVNRHSLNGDEFVNSSIDQQRYTDYDAAAQEKENHADAVIIPIFNAQNQLSAFDRSAQFTSFIPVKDTTPKSLARMANFISRSISSVSQAIQDGGESIPLSF